MNSLTSACMADATDMTEGIYAVDGLSGKRYRNFINRLMSSLTKPQYLEVSLYKGATFCAAIDGMCDGMAVGIDNWSKWADDAPREAFHINANDFCPNSVNAIVYDQDFRTVDFVAAANGGTFDVLFFDGPHEEKDQYDGVSLPLPAMSDEFVLIVDDWNWDAVRKGTFSAILDHALNMVYTVEIRTVPHGLFPFKVEQGKDSDWHNGYFIAVLRRP